MLVLSAVSIANANPITVSFEVTGFGASAPTDPVEGTIVYDAASTTSDINSLTSVNLTIDGHAYTLGELGFAKAGSDQQIGGLLNGVATVDGGTNDFYLLWNETALTPDGFVYSVPASTSVNFISFNFTKFNVTATPEPSVLGLALLGAIGICLRGRRQFRN